MCSSITDSDAGAMLVELEVPPPDSSGPAPSLKVTGSRRARHIPSVGPQPKESDMTRHPHGCPIPDRRNYPAEQWTCPECGHDWWWQRRLGCWQVVTAG